MMMRKSKSGRWLAGICLVLFGLAFRAEATVQGISGPTFNLTAGEAQIATPDGDSLLIWAFGDDDGKNTPQYPGPTLIVEEGQTVTVNLTNDLPVATSMLFPGQTGVTASGGVAGMLTNEAADHEARDQALGDKVRASAEFQEGINAFKEKRQPDYG